MQVATGTYAGTGGSGVTITGVGFKPTVVFTMDASTSEAFSWVTSLDVAGHSQNPNDATDWTTAITSLDADGFKVGADDTVDKTGVTFHYLCLRDDDSAVMHVGSYTGNQTQTSITGSGFDPDFVWLGHHGIANVLTYHVGMSPGDNGLRMFQLSGIWNNLIEGLVTDGFSIGARTDGNWTGKLFQYMTFINTAGNFEAGTYTGNGVDDHSVSFTDTSMNPAFMLVRTQGTGAGIVKFDTYAAGFSQQPDGNGNTGLSYDNTAIKTMGTGAFTLGTLAAVNTNLQAYDYIAIMNAAVAGGGLTGAFRTFESFRGYPGY